ncbi:MAG TPA: phage tail sheath C-terminal domain-containing protein [Chitinophagaceae bacterium]|nr:phage tail sheath C-terminal domain-containing protein [Chitinophagaceae bacterium]
MATVYKTPGVYIEEIPKFPPSIAQVETAIPAFVGYTEKAAKLAPGDLLNIPTKLSSMIEFEQYFGYGPSPDISNIIIDDNNNFVTATVSNNFFLYDSMRLFFANGGGDCYIVSVATYDTATKTKAEFLDPNKGLDALKKFDEPTIIVMPDVVLLTTGNDMYDVQQAALAQCNDLQDRVAVFDLKQSDPKGTDFRNKIGINFLKYGMAYTPWLKVNLPKNLTYADVKDDIKRGSTSTTLSALTTDAGILAQISGLENITADVTKIETQTAALSAPQGSLRDRFSALDTTFTTTPTVANFQNIFAFLFSIARKLDEFVGGTPAALANTTLKNQVKTSISSDLQSVFNTLITYEQEAVMKLAGYNARFDEPVVPTAPEWGTIFSVPAGASTVMSGGTDEEEMGNMIDNVRLEFDKINRVYLSSLSTASTTLAKELDASLQLSFPVYKNILAGISNSMTAMPPSGAVVGVYAMIDRTRGVWKAPANVSLSYVIEPDTVFTKSELDALNVDVVAGKSINAIRTFFGKGTLIYGGRTLAGNDNEWRYVSVRRFFNMVEESTKKATEQFVFEPNDANTWVKVQAMIENFLMVLWRQGALQGAKPEHAFYVAVGLGKTMTALDILEGRMNVEIGMAVVRPAEFIVLKFSHKMPES